MIGQITGQPRVINVKQYRIINRICPMDRFHDANETTLNIFDNPFSITYLYLLVKQHPAEFPITNLENKTVTELLHANPGKLVAIFTEINVVLR